MNYANCFFDFLCLHYASSLNIVSPSLVRFVSIDHEKSFTATNASKDHFVNSHLHVNRSNSTPMNLFYTNARSLLPKMHSLRNYASIHMPSIIAVTETWLTQDIPSSLLGLPNFVIYRKDRTLSKGGGSILMIDANIPSKVILLPINNVHKIDAVACELSVHDGSRMGVLCIYRPPNSSILDNIQMLDIIMYFLKLELEFNIVMGDFNFPDIQWPHLAFSQQSKCFLDFTQENFLHQHVTSATRRSSNSILDLIFTTPGTVIDELGVNEELDNSDHCCIQCSLKTHAAKAKKKIKLRNYKQADWLLFQQLISSSDWPRITPETDIDHLWDKFLSIVMAALDTVAPHYFVSSRSFTSTSQVRTALRHKRRAFRSLKEHPSFSNIVLYKKSVAIAKRVVQDDLRMRENKILMQKDSKSFWSYVNRRLSKNYEIKSILRSESDTCVEDQEEIADVFNHYFASVFSFQQEIKLSDQPLDSDILSLDSVTVSPHEIFEILKTIAPKTSNDGDGLSYKVLKEGGIPLVNHLTDLYSLSLSLGQLPSAWKIALVTPIHKNGPKNKTENYRPISVTSCCCRVLERVVKKKITEFLAKNNLIRESQHGFQAGKSTDTLLIKFYDFVTDKIDKNMIVDAVFFDLSKAFDKIPHDLLIQRLHGHGISGTLLAWIENFLSKRFQRVRVGNSISNLLPVSSGVIQGSVLGPLLFNCFINDIDTLLEHCSILKYADDLRIFRASPKHDSALVDLQMKLQQDINSIFNWAKSSKMSFNVKKCFYVTFGRSSENFTRFYEIDNTIVPDKSCFNDLGVTVTTTPFSFNNHMDTTVTKAFTKLGILNRVFSVKSQNSILRLYKAFVRPTIEYASVIWSPYTISYQSKVERVQKRMCRIIPGIRDLPYNKQVASLGILSLQARRLRFQLIIMYKMFNNLINIDADEIFTLRNDNRIRGHTLTVNLKFARNNYRLNFFTVSAISFWNKLPQVVVYAPTLTQFKCNLASYFLKNDVW